MHSVTPRGFRRGNRPDLVVPSLVAALALATTANAAMVFTIPAPNGVGDVVALTNALAQLSAAPASASGNYNARVWLEPGVYDLDGIYMTASDHLKVSYLHGGIIAGLGDGPGDVVLKGGGEAGAHRVISCGGSNYSWLTISNLTVTGGWTAGDGGGINADAKTRYYDLIVSNNYAKGSNGGGGGGIMRGRAMNCLIAGNRTDQRGGGLWIDGGGGQTAFFVSGAFDCVFEGNWAKYYGGALFGRGKCLNNAFRGNSCDSYGGGVAMSAGPYSWFGGRFAETNELAECAFEGNAISSSWGHGTALYNVSYETARLPVRDCTFVGNNSDVGGYGVVYGCGLLRCSVERNLRAGEILYDCALDQCRVCSNTNTANGQVVVNCKTGGTTTNVNTLIEGNVARSYGGIVRGAVLVNCTIADNRSENGGNYGDIIRNCPSWNCLFTGNYIGPNQRDIRQNYLNESYALSLTNCVFTSADVPADGEGLGGCVATAKLKLDGEAGGYTPSPTSPLCDKGLQSPWILELVGAADFAGNPRIVHRGLDIGAFECQKYPPVTRVMLR